MSDSLQKKRGGDGRAEMGKKLQFQNSVRFARKALYYYDFAIEPHMSRVVSYLSRALLKTTWALMT